MKSIIFILKITILFNLVSCSKKVPVIFNGQLIIIEEKEDQFSINKKTFSYKTKSVTEKVISIKKETKEVKGSCSYMGFCMDCGIGFDGQFSCFKPSMKISCDGERDEKRAYTYTQYNKIITYKGKEDHTFTSPILKRTTYDLLSHGDCN